MFTLPFAAFYGTSYVLETYFHITSFANTAWSVAAAVVVVNLIIAAYVYQASKEPYDPPVPPHEDGSHDSKPVASKSQLNKED